MIYTVKKENLIVMVLFSYLLPVQEHVYASSALK